MDLVLNSTRVGDSVVVTVVGEADAMAAPQLDAYLGAVVAEESPTLLVVDLAGVEFLDSTGLGVIIKALTHQREVGSDLALISPTPRVAKVLSITGMDQVMTVGDALADVVGGGQ